MLVLTRKMGETICLGSDITVTVVDIRGDRIRLGVEAPKHVPILRSELQERVPPMPSKQPKPDVVVEAPA